MDHDTADDLVLDLVEGTLSASVDADVRAHVAGCDTCRGNVDRLAQARLLSTTAARELTAERTGDPPRATIDAQVLGAASRAAASRRGRRRRRKIGREVAVCAILAAIVAAGSLIAAAW